MTNERTRCGWSSKDPAMITYHDSEWGVPVHDEVKQFEFLVLEGAQAGLSWSTILNKREGYRKAFRGFDPERVARMSGRDVERLLALPGATIVRNRRKIESAIVNARSFLKVQEEQGSFDRYLWAFVDGRPVVNHWRRLGQIPPSTPLSDRISRDLAQRGFRFCGSTIVYAHLQAAGLVNDHLVTCFRHAELVSRT